MNRLHEAMMLNNEGAILLMSGKTLEALRMLSHAGKVLLGTNADGSDDNVDPSTLLLSQEQHGSYHENNGENTAMERTITPLSTPCPSTTTTTSGKFYVCTRPLVFPLDSVDEKISTTEAEMDTLVDTVSLYIVFNMALGCHHFGIVTGKDAPLRRAMELYHEVLNTTTTTATTTTTKSQSVIMECIVLNNLCHIYIEWCQYNVCQYYMHRLQDAMIDFLSLSGQPQQHCHVHKDNNNDNIVECDCTTTIRTTHHHHYLTPHEVWEMILNGFLHHHHTPPPAAHAA